MQVIPPSGRMPKYQSQCAVCGLHAGIYRLYHHRIEKAILGLRDFWRFIPRFAGRATGVNAVRTHLADYRPNIGTHPYLVQYDS